MNSPTTPIPNAVLEKVREALEFYAGKRDSEWLKHVCDTYSGETVTLEWNGDTQDEPQEVAEKALTALTNAIAATQPTETGKSAVSPFYEYTAELMGLKYDTIGEKAEKINEVVNRIQTEARMSPPEPRNGWVWVPKEPTEAMLKRGICFLHADEHIPSLLGAYTAMLAVVPQLPNSNGWQPIETAPKDRIIEVKTATGDIHKTSWREISGGYWPDLDSDPRCDVRDVVAWRDVIKPASPPCVGGNG